MHARRMPKAGRVVLLLMRAAVLLLVVGQMPGKVPGMLLAWIPRGVVQGLIHRASWLLVHGAGLCSPLGLLGGDV